MIQAEKYWGGVRNNVYLEEPNCSMNGRPGSIISYLQNWKKTRSFIPLVNDGISITIWVLYFENNNCAVSKFCERSQQLIASKDVSAQTFGLSATKHGSQVSTVVHQVVCCVGWVHSCWVHFLWEFPGCWNFVLARKVNICIIIVPGKLCSRDNRTVTNAYHSCSPGYSSLKSHSYWLNSLLLKINWWMASFSSSSIKFSQLTKVQVCRGHGTVHAMLTEDVPSYVQKLMMWRRG